MFVPVIVFGSLSIAITGKNIKEQINKNNSNLLKQAKENIEIILNDADSINLNLMAYPDMISQVGEILNKPNMEADDYIAIGNTRKIIDASAFSRPYVRSIYIYFDNMQKRLLTTSEGLVKIDNYYDKLWFDSYSKMDTSREFWVEAREIRQYEFEKDRTDVITLYRKLYYTSVKRVGAIVLNFYTDYIDQLLSNLDMYPGQIILIMDENGNEIFSYCNEDETVGTGKTDIMGRTGIMSEAGKISKDQENEKYVENEEKQVETEVNLKELKENQSPFFVIEIDKDSYIINQLYSPKYNLKYISITPGKYLYSIPSQLTLITILLLVASLIIGTVLTLAFSRKNFNFINNIITVFEKAEKGEPLPSQPAKIKDEYSFIIYNIIKVFLEHNYLKIQLSERKYKLKVMEMIALHSQINPHFLFNTLKTVYWKAIDLTGGHNDVSEMVESLSTIIDYSLNSYEEFVTMSKEINNTKKYIDIQQIRYRDKFNVVWEYSNEIENYKTIKLILQPLIENSIHHGINEKEGRCRIRIRITQVNNCLKITVIDNGNGINRENLIKIRKRLSQYESDKNSVRESGKNIGLYNTNRRLQLTYGEKYGLQINSKYGMGTVVYVTIPLAVTTETQGRS